MALILAKMGHIFCNSYRQSISGVSLESLDSAAPSSGRGGPDYPDPLWLLIIPLAGAVENACRLLPSLPVAPPFSTTPAFPAPADG
jgi:hypothetical protein